MWLVDSVQVNTHTHSLLQATTIIKGEIWLLTLCLFAWLWTCPHIVMYLTISYFIKIFHVITVSHDNLFLIAFQRKQPGQELFVWMLTTINMEGSKLWKFIMNVLTS